MRFLNFIESKNYEVVLKHVTRKRSDTDIDFIQSILYKNKKPEHDVPSKCQHNLLHHVLASQCQYIKINVEATQDTPTIFTRVSLVVCFIREIGGEC